MAALLPAAVAVIIIAPLTRFGPNQQVANTTLGVLWSIFTILGYRADDSVVSPIIGSG